ncbi:MAG: hypothetical protein IJV31_02555 [Clostridia bacterium]|nr:hypothetical protein [Clostridia bacterium]
MEKPTICRYCGSPVVYTSNAEIYGREYGEGKCYLCRNCRAFVGVHPGTDIPLGTLADEELRRYRKAAHFWFDKIWKSPTRITTRDKAYKWLSKELGLPKEETHIGMFEKEQCEKVMEISQKRLQESGVAIWN